MVSIVLRFRTHFGVGVGGYTVLEGRMADCSSMGPRLRSSRDTELNLQVFLQSRRPPQIILDPLTGITTTPFVYSLQTT